MSRPQFVKQPPFLTTQEVADYLASLGVPTSARTLESWRREQKGPDYYRVHGRVLYRPRAVRQWLAEAERKTAPTGTDSGASGGERVPA